MPVEENGRGDGSTVHRDSVEQRNSPHAPSSEEALSRDAETIRLALSEQGRLLPATEASNVERTTAIIQRFLQHSPVLHSTDILGCAISRLTFDYVPTNQRLIANTPWPAWQAKAQAIRDVAAVADPRYMDAAGFAAYALDPDGRDVTIALVHNFEAWARASLAPDLVLSTSREQLLAQLRRRGEVMPRINSRRVDAALGGALRLHRHWARNEVEGGRESGIQDRRELGDLLISSEPMSMIYRAEDGSYRLDPKALVAPLRRTEYCTTAPVSLDEPRTVGDGAPGGTGPDRASLRTREQEAHAATDARDAVERTRRWCEGRMKIPVRSNAGALRRMRPYLYRLLSGSMTQAEVADLTGHARSTISRHLESERRALLAAPEFATEAGDQGE